MFTNHKVLVPRTNYMTSKFKMHVPRRYNFAAKFYYVKKCDIGCRRIRCTSVGLTMKTRSNILYSLVDFFFLFTLGIKSVPFNWRTSLKDLKAYCQNFKISPINKKWCLNFTYFATIVLSQRENVLGTKHLYDSNIIKTKFKIKTDKLITNDS